MSATRPECPWHGGGVEELGARQHQLCADDPCHCAMQPVRVVFAAYHGV